MNNFWINLLDMRFSNGLVESPALFLSKKQCDRLSPDRVQWSLFNNTVQWDGYALTFQTMQVKHSLYLISGASGALPNTLYRSQKLANPLFSKAKQDQSLTVDDSYSAPTLCVLREYVYDFIAVPYQFLSNPANLTVRKVLRIVLWIISAYLSPLSLLLDFTLLVATRRIVSRSQMTPKYKNLSDYYPAKEMATGMGLGTLATIPLLYSNELLSKGADGLIERLVTQHSQDIVRWMMDPNVVFLFKAYVIAIVCLGAPVMEEVVFRGWLRDHSLAEKTITPHKSLKGPPQTGDSPHLKTLLKTSLMFGLAHYSLHQGLTNFRVICVTTVLGIMLCLLTELTENLWAATTAHALHNTYIALRVHDVIRPVFGLP